eukprot:306992-Rhodomonas_salina.1
MPAALETEAGSEGSASTRASRVRSRGVLQTRLVPTHAGSVQREREARWFSTDREVRCVRRNGGC